MARVFVSYSHSVLDESLAKELAAALATRNEVFIDTRIPGGQPWGEIIDRELHTADYLIPLLSANSVKSPMVLDEVEQAHQLNREFRRPGIIPVRLDDTQFTYPLRPYISRFQQLKWNGPHDTPRVIAETLRAVDYKPPSFGPSRERMGLIERVRADWIDGVLMKSLYASAPLSPDLERQPKAVERRLDAIIQRPDEKPTPLPHGTKLSSVFDDHLGQLLILGQPGSGKTTLLLGLAKELLDRSEADPDEPIPVVFNLSSWALRRPPLEEWLIEELRLRSDVTGPAAPRFVRQEELTILLDGLDEVAARYRDDCVDAINQFRSEHGFVKIAICCRLAEHEALTRKLRLPAAILILPLKPPEIIEYLQDVGATRTADSVRKAVSADPGLMALLDTPLTLSIVAIVGEKLPTTGPSESVVGMEQRRTQLFAMYVEEMFHRRSAEERYKPEQMRRWLAWLAGKMVQWEQTSFRIEDLRRSWLEKRFERVLVVLAITLFVAFTSGLLGGVLMIAFLSAMLRRDTHVSFADIAPYVSVFFVPSFMAIGAILSIIRGRAQKPVDLVEVHWPGLCRLMIAALEGSLLGGLLGFVFGWAGCYVFEHSTTGGEGGWLRPPRYASMAAIAFGVGNMLSVVARPRQIEIRPTPNSVLTQSLKATLVYISLSVGLGTAGIVTVARMNLDPNASTMPLSAIVGGGGSFLAWVGFFFGLEKGGYFLLDHYLTRLLLWRRKRLPWNYVRFLDAAADRVLLRKVGSGYIFIHRMLLDYFAGKDRISD